MRNDAREHRKAIEAVSSLKRALGIPNHPAKTDSIWQGSEVVAYTQDEASATLLAEIFYRFATGGFGRVMRTKNYNPSYTPNSAKAGIASEGVYYAKVNVPDAGIFKERMQQFITEYVSPGKVRPRYI